MSRARDEVRALLRRQGGVVQAREHPHLCRTMNRMALDGELLRVLPGTYAAPDDERGVIPLRAVCRRFPDAVVTGTAAAAATFWPEVGGGPITVARAMSTQPSCQPYRFAHRAVPPGLVRSVDGVRVTAPALTAVDLIDSHGAEAIDQVLRRRAATVPGLHAALAASPGRRGNNQRRRVLLDSRGAPWSEAERRAHRLLRAAGITGWVANMEIRIRLGWFVQSYFLDIAFPKTRRALEIEGDEFHQDRAALHRDRYRHNDIVVRAGWESMRVDWPMLIEDPGYVVELGRYAEGHAA